MKRIIFALLIAFASAIVFSCTEDEVAPQKFDSTAAGGSGVDSVRR